MPFALFEGGELTGLDYARKKSGGQAPAAFVSKLAAKKNDPLTFVLQFEYYETAPPALFSIIGTGGKNGEKAVAPPRLNNIMIAKAITAIEELRPKIWPLTKDPSAVGPYRPQDTAGKYIVQKMYPASAQPSYFNAETEYAFSWVPDKESAHIFPTYEDAFVFAKRTEGEHAQRIRDGKGAGHSVTILLVE